MYDEYGEPSEAFIMAWNEHNDHSENVIDTDEDEDNDVVYFIRFPKASNEFYKEWRYVGSPLPGVTKEKITSDVIADGGETFWIELPK